MPTDQSPVLRYQRKIQMANCRIGMESRRTGWLAAAGDSLHIRMLKTLRRSSGGGICRPPPATARAAGLWSPSVSHARRDFFNLDLLSLNGHNLISREKLLYYPCLIKILSFYNQRLRIITAWGTWGSLITVTYVSMEVYRPAGGEGHSNSVLSRAHKRPCTPPDTPLVQRCWSTGTACAVCLVLLFMRRHQRG